MISKYHIKARTAITQYGDSPIQSIQIVRQPILEMWSHILNALTFGEFKRRMDATPYDKLFHLSLVLNTQAAPITVEKNDIINITPNKPISQDAEIQSVDNIRPGLTLSIMLENARAYMGDTRFFNYSAVYNNCQDFVMALLKSNNLGSQQNYEFVKQDVKTIFKGMNFLRKFVNTVTDVVGWADMYFTGGTLKQELDLKEAYDFIKSARSIEGSGVSQSNPQSVIFDKSKYTPTQAIKWLKSKGLKYDKIDEKVRTYRFRQFPPSRKCKYRTISIGEGIKFVMCYPKNEPTSQHPQYSEDALYDLVRSIVLEQLKIS